MTISQIADMCRPSHSHSLSVPPVSCIKQLSRWRLVCVTGTFQCSLTFLYRYLPMCARVHTHMDTHTRIRAQTAPRHAIPFPPAAYFPLSAAHICRHLWLLLYAHLSQYLPWKATNKFSYCATWPFLLLLLSLLYPPFHFVCKFPTSKHTPHTRTHAGTYTCQQGKSFIGKLPGQKQKANCSLLPGRLSKSALELV